MGSQLWEVCDKTEGDWSLYSLERVRSCVHYSKVWLLEVLPPVLPWPSQIWIARGRLSLPSCLPTQDLMAKVRAMLAASKNLQTSAS